MERIVNPSHRRQETTYLIQNCVNSISRKTCYFQKYANLHFFCCHTTSQNKKDHQK